jgi:hypothetical protein
VSEAFLGCQGRGARRRVNVWPAGELARLERSMGGRSSDHVLMSHGAAGCRQARSVDAAATRVAGLRLKSQEATLRRAQTLTFGRNAAGSVCHVRSRPLRGTHS